MTNNIHGYLIARESQRRVTRRKMCRLYDEIRTGAGVSSASAASIAQHILDLPTIAISSFRSHQHVALWTIRLPVNLLTFSFDVLRLRLHYFTRILRFILLYKDCKSFLLTCGGGLNGAAQVELLHAARSYAFKLSAILIHCGSRHRSACTWVA